MSFVISSGSKQYLVKVGQKFVVDRLHSEENSEVTFDVLYSVGETKKTKITAKIVKHQRGKKIRIVKYKAKSNYHRQYGYRHEETVLEILG
jgi:large subunit ribosomal protein L21